MTTTEPSLLHKDKTLQDLMDSMSPDERELQALIVGAAVEDESLTDPATTKEYEALSTEKKYLIDFLVGNILAEQIKHSEPELDDYLAHFGVKGMQWGVRKSISGSSAQTSARAKVKSGSATLGEAHGAALKSTGHRVINALTGDKTFWKRTAITAGVAATVAAAATAAPLVLPTATLVSIGSAVTGATSVGGVGLVSGSLVNLAEVGAAAIFSAGVTTATVGAGVATVGNVIGNTSRAIQGNSRINKSYASLGKTISDRQTAGSKRVNKILRKDGSISKKDLKHDAILVDAFLADHATAKLIRLEQDA